MCKDFERSGLFLRIINKTTALNRKIFTIRGGFLPALLLVPVFLTQCNSPDRQATGNQAPGPGIDFSLTRARQVLTAENTGYRLSLTGELGIEDYDQPDEHLATIILDPSKQFQEIEGFGGALTDASAETFFKLPEEKREELLKAYFDTDEGLGYNLCRTHINSCDFSSESYAYSEVSGDTELEHFNIDHDLEYRIPLIQEAIKYSGNTLKLFASPWSPPAWMKTNNNMLQGGKLKPEYYSSWANYYIKFFDAYAEEGISFWGLTVQNEPMAVQTWESCIYTAEEERDFVRDYLGPALEKFEMEDLNLIVYDHNRGVLYHRAGTIYDDPEASRYVWGAGFHWYTGDHFENVKLLAEAYPDKKILFTEGCVFPFNYDSLSVWHWGERYGESIIHDLNNGTVGWVDWNILLDETGGPNHVSNFCYAPVIGNTETGELIYMNSYYYLGHFSKYIRPGARRIICSSNNDELLATAFINTDETIAVVIMNDREEEIEFRIWIDRKGVPVSLPAHSIATVLLD